MALKLRRILPGIAHRAPAEGTQHPVDGLAIPVQQVAVHQLVGAVPAEGRFVQGAEAGLGHLHGPGAGQAQNADGPGARGGGDGGDELGHGGTSSPKGKSLANPPANFPLTGIFDDQNGETGLCTACGKVCGQCVKPLNSFPFHRKGRCTQEQIFLQKAPKWPWSERTKEKSTCKNDESVTKG